MKSSKVNHGLLTKWIVFMPLILLISVVVGAIDGFIKVIKQAETDIFEG